MSKKNRKNNRKANNTGVSIEVKTTNNRTVLIAKFDYILNTFYCPCGGKLFWTGGRFSNNRTMEVLKCEHCGKSIDPSMVMQTAINALVKWEEAKANYFATAANRSAAAYLAEEKARRQANRPVPQNKGIFSKLFGFAFAS